MKKLATAMMFSLVILLLALLLPACTPKASTPSTPEVTIDMMTAPLGTLSMSVGLAIGDIARKNHPWLRITSAETPGTIYNMEFLDANPALWKTSIPQAADSAEWLARSGKAPFTKQVLGMKRILNYCVGTYHFTTLNPNIKTINDLVGKKVALGYKPQIAWTIVPEMILQYGYGILDKINIQYVGTDAATTALIDGTVDAALSSVLGNEETNQWYPQPQLVQLIGTGKPIYHISYDKEALIKTTKATGLPIAWVSIPKGKFESQNQDLFSYVLTATVIAKDVFPENLAYEFTKLWIDNASKFKGYFSLGEVFTPKYAAFSVTKANGHPGAIRAYEEAGITLPDK